ncbi:MAG: class B sortase, partial [Oscillospiraceae bacterium]|nr:class B sortase [Oscillospiraceae bacterium]
MNQKKQEKSQWWTRFIPVKGDDKREIIRKCIFWVAIVVFVCSIAYILSVRQESVYTEKLTQELGNMLVVDENYEVVDDYPDDYLTKFAALWERNEDIAGWIEIAGTKLNYPVVQANSNTKYHRADFDGNYNDHGVPYVDYRADIKKPSTNTVIYGHNMNDGQMFGELMNYKKISYYTEHPTFRYDTVYKENEYKILGVFLVTANDPEFMYHSMIDLDEAGLTEFVNQVRARSLINTKIDVNTADKLVTLSTCDYSFRDAQGNRVARFVVVGRAIREGEDPAVDTSIVTLNASPVMPAEWYEQIKRNQEAAELAAAEAASQAALESVNPDNITAWLTQEEIDAYTAEGYSPEDLEFFASERRYALLEWLDEEEMTGMTPAEKLSAMRSRRDRKWLSEEDRDAHLTEEEKLEKIAANQAAAAILTQEELAKCRSWKDIQELITKKLETMCETQGCTLPRGHQGLHSNQKKCSEAGCEKVEGHQGMHTKQENCQHSYTSTVTKESTCKEKGTTTYKCDLCKHTYTEDIPASHNFKAGEVIAPTATERGYTIYTCDKCGATENRDFKDPVGSSSS